MACLSVLMAMCLHTGAHGSRANLLIRLHSSRKSYGSLNSRSILSELRWHTSSLGDTNVNKNLSMGRADSIKRSLIEEGRVDASRITAMGLGEAQPIVKEGENKEERNRRVDIIIQTN